MLSDLSWQSLAAFLAHKEDNNILKEFYTIKDNWYSFEFIFLLNNYHKRSTH